MAQVIGGDTLRTKSQNTLTVILFALYSLLLVGVIIFKLPFYSGSSEGVRVINLVPVFGSFDENGVLVTREIISNILLFIPLGIYISVLRDNWSFMKKILAIVCVTLGFEVIQYVFAIGISDITDILNNTLGGLIGIGIYVLLVKFLKKRAITAINVFALLITFYVVLRFSHLFYISHFVMGRPGL